MPLLELLHRCIVSHSASDSTTAPSGAHCGHFSSRLGNGPHNTMKRCQHSPPPSAQSPVIGILRCSTVRCGATASRQTALLTTTNEGRGEAMRRAAATRPKPTLTLQMAAAFASLLQPSRAWERVWAQAQALQRVPSSQWALWRQRAPSPKRVPARQRAPL